MTRKKLWTTIVLLAASGAWIGCEPMSQPMSAPRTPTQESKPTDTGTSVPDPKKEAEATPDKPAESSDKDRPASKDEVKKPEETKPDEKKPNDPEKTDA